MPDAVAVLCVCTRAVSCLQGVGCGGGRNPDDAMPFVHSARKGKEAREQLQESLLHLAKLKSVQVRPGHG